MSLRLQSWESVSAFRDASPAWDDLWARSGVALPTVRAELVADWTEQFAAGRRFHALAVEQAGKLVAGMALVGARWKRLLSIGTLTNNAWAHCGEFLLDQNVDFAAACSLLADGLKRSPWRMMRLEGVPLEAPHWRALREALSKSGMPALAKVDYEVGQVQVPADWNALEEQWSRNHRHKLRRIANKLDRCGVTALERHTGLDPADVPDMLRCAFAIEDRGWKGDGGTSVLAQPAIFEFYCRIGRKLAEWNALDLAFLKTNDERIAFHCGSRAKGTTFASKVGFDGRFSEYSPGNALLNRLLRAEHEENGPWTHDFAGPLSDWTARFATRRYPVGTLLLGRGDWISRGLLRGSGIAAKPWLR